MVARIGLKDIASDSSFSWEDGTVTPITFAVDNWKQVAASVPWPTRRYNALTRVGNDVLLLYGGSNPTLLNDVWRSDDFGATWTEVTAPAIWSGRDGPANAATEDGTLVIAGGFASPNALRDVWRTADEGLTWQLATSEAAWPKRRGSKMLAIHDNGLLLIGGFAHNPSNTWYADVWLSTDYGSTWTIVTDNPGWSARMRLGGAVLSDGTVVIAGGWSASSRTSDVWTSTNDGATWSEATAAALWGARDHVAMVAMPDDTLVVYSGFDGAAQHGVFISTDRGATWTTTAASFPAFRYYIQQAAVVMSDGRIVVAGGSISGGSGYAPDVWVGSPRPTLWGPGEPAGAPEPCGSLDLHCE